MNEAVLLARSVWTPELCRDIRKAMDDGEAEPAEIVDGGFTLDTVARNALDVTLSPAWTRTVEAAVQALWPRIESFFAIDVSWSVGVTCLRYQEGGLYRRHRDRDPAPGSGTDMRRVSLIVWLSTATTTRDRGEFDGGTLRLYPEGADAIDIPPVAGTLVAFPSDWSHEVLPVTRGTRDAIVDWVY